jgi:hypothetical protein
MTPHGVLSEKFLPLIDLLQSSKAPSTAHFGKLILRHKMETKAFKKIGSKTFENLTENRYAKNVTSLAKMEDKETRSVVWNSKKNQSKEEIQQKYNFLKK